MILYFSGTGNSQYVAERVAAITGDALVCLNDKIKNSDFRAMKGGERLIIVTPTYAWRIPRVVDAWLRRVDFGPLKAWFVMTCGGEIGNAAKYNRLLCRDKNFTYMGTAQILMPENYIAMFDAPQQSEAERIIRLAEPAIRQAGEQIKEGVAFPVPRNHLYDRFMSGVVNGPFYQLCVKADAFYAKEQCVGCGKCVAVCPLNNITLRNGKPSWGKECTHCMACICHCPTEAIEYGKKSAGKPRYICRKTEG